MMLKGLNADISLNKGRKHFICMIVKTVYSPPFVLEKVKKKKSISFQLTFQWLFCQDGKARRAA